MIKIFILSSFIALAIDSHAQDKNESPLSVVPSVDLNRYMGTWYEVARLPNSFQKKCAGDVTATYELLDDGGIRVVNRCRKENGEMTEASGRAKRASTDKPNTKLKVLFAPAFLSFLPFVWGDYWIILLADDYSYAVIGEPDREYLWILSRTPTMEDTTFENLCAQIRDKGYDLRELKRTKNTGN